MIFNTGYFISANYLKALIFLVLWLHFKYPLYVLSMKQSDSLMCRNLVIQQHNSKTCLFNKGKLDHTLLVALTKSLDHHFFFDFIKHVCKGGSRVHNHCVAPASRAELIYS